MAEYDFFDITGIQFDPPAKKAEVINIAVEAAKTKFNSSAGEASKKAENDDIIIFLEKKRQLYIDGDRTSADFKKAATEKRENVEEILYRQAIVRYQSLNPTGNNDLKIPISEGEIRKDALKKNIQNVTAKRVYEKAGFIVEKNADVADLKKNLPKFTSESNFKALQDRIKALRTLDKFYDSKFMGREKVVNIYSFAAYVNSDIDRIDDYEKESTKFLCETMKKIKTEYPGTTGNDTISLYNGLAALAEKHVFSDDKLRASYDMYILYHSDDMEKLYEELKITPPDLLIDSGLAEAYIDRIARVFPDRETAIAIYNKEAGLFANVPYVPEKKTYYIICSNCGMQNKFNNVFEAEKTDECQYCHKRLFKTCNKCGKKVLENKDRCDCGYVFPDLIKFNIYMNRAEDALRRGLLDEADENLKIAKSAAPEEKSRFLPLEKQLMAEQQKYAAPKKQLEQYISEKKYVTAEKYLSEILSKYPQLNVDIQRKQISNTINECRHRFDISSTKSRSERINAAIEILDICVDYSLAIEYLRMTPPAKCTGLVCTPNAKNSCIALKWQPHCESRVLYRLLRKEGSSAPINEEDGVIVAKSFSGTSFTDNDITPGEKYTYSLFAERGGIFSDAICTTCIVLSMVSDVKYTQLGGKLHFDWRLPDNCESVKVSKIVDGKETIIDLKARNNADDNSLVYNKQHVYCFIANYGVAGSSEVVRVSVLPTVIIDKFSISVKKENNNIYNVSWDIRQSGIDLQILVNGYISKQSRSDIKNCSVELPENGFYKLQAKAYSGGTWIDSKNCVDVNTYQPWMFKGVATEIKGTNSKGSINKVQLELIMEGNQPTGSIGFLYFVRVKNNISEPAPWVNSDEAIKASDACRTTMAAYSRERKIIHSIIAKQEDAYYVTLYTCYLIDGKEILSAPARRKITRPLHANIFWGVSKSLFSGRSLQIETKANRAFYRRPALVLCASTTGRHLLSENDSAAELILSIEEKMLADPVSEMKEVFEIKGSLAKGDRLFLFEKNKIASEDFDIRWQKNFEGKV